MELIWGIKLNSESKMTPTLDINEHIHLTKNTDAQTNIFNYSYDFSDNHDNDKLKVLS